MKVDSRIVITDWNSQIIILGRCNGKAFTANILNDLYAKKKARILTDLDLFETTENLERVGILTTVDALGKYLMFDLKKG